jgi:hypothetical protein
VILIAIFAVSEVLMNGESSGCGAIILHSFTLERIPLPRNCSLTQSRPDAEREVLSQLEYWTRDLGHRRWIVCQGQPEAAPLNPLANGGWMPTYVSGGYQFRRTLIRSAFNRSTPNGGKSLEGAVGLVPWSRYLGQIAGHCNDKFSGWK